MEEVERFNIRVYGILVDNNAVLVSDEIRKGNYMTKFPGGGLELGEGIEDCLIREFKEELGIEIAVGDVYYFTKHFQKSAFNPKDQLISLYFKVFKTCAIPIAAVSKPFEGAENKEMVPRWITFEHLKTDMVTYPIDKLVVQQLIDEI